MRFVRRELFIEPADFQVLVIFERAALDASLRKFDVLQRNDLCESVLYSGERLRSYFVRHVQVDNRR